MILAVLVLNRPRAIPGIWFVFGFGIHLAVGFSERVCHQYLFGCTVCQQYLFACMWLLMNLLQGVRAHH